MERKKRKQLGWCGRNKSSLLLNHICSWCEERPREGTEESTKLQPLEPPVKVPLDLQGEKINQTLLCREIWWPLLLLPSKSKQSSPHGSVHMKKTSISSWPPFFSLMTSLLLMNQIFDSLSHVHDIICSSAFFFYHSDKAAMKEKTGETVKVKS